MRVIKPLIALVVLAALGWTGWWFLLASGQEAALSHWFAERREKGWQAEHGEIDVSGFPMKLDRRIEDIALTDPATGWSWELPEVTLEGAAQSPTVLRLVFPETHRISLPREKIDVTHHRLAAFLSLTPGQTLALREASMEGEAFALTGQSGWTARAADLAAALTLREPEAGPANSYNLAVRAIDVALPKPLLALIDPTGLLESKVDEVVWEGHAALAAPIDRIALEDGRLAVKAATIRNARLTWGDLAVEMQGSVEVDAAGYPDGKMKLRLRNWRRMIAIAREGGAVDRNVLDAVEQALGFVALLAGNDTDLSVPLNLSGGKIRIGPVAVADAPRLAPPDS